MNTAAQSVKSRAGWINLLLIPVKQHAICCGLVPLLAVFAGGTLSATLENPKVEMAMDLLFAPLMTFLIMWGEQKWHDHKVHHHECGCGHSKILTWRNYLMQAALGYVIYAVAHSLLPHHHAPLQSLITG